MLDLNDLRLFALAVEHGGFAGAARRLGIPKSTLSKRLAALEARLGVRLVERGPRSFVPTELGREVLEHARAVTIQGEGAEEAVERRLAAPRGRVRLTTSVPIAQFQLAPHLPALARALPRVVIELHATDRFVDLVQEGFDIAVRSHFAPLADSDLVQRRAMVEPVWIVGAPAYLDGRGRPRSPCDIAAHDGLLVAIAAGRWRLSDEAGNAVEVAPEVRLAADESAVLLAAAREGLGLASLPESICCDALADGSLERVLPGWTAGIVTTSLLMPARRSQLPAVRAVADHLVARLGGR